MQPNPRQTALAIRDCLDELAIEAEDSGLVELADALSRTAVQAATLAAMLAPRAHLIDGGHLSH